MLTLQLSNQLLSVSQHNMKVELIRSTMIAGTPTSVGSSIEVEDNVARMLILSGKAIEYVEKPKPKPKKKPTPKKEEI